MKEDKEERKLQLKLQPVFLAMWLGDKESKYSIEILQGIYYILLGVHVGLSVDIRMSGYLAHDHRCILAYLSLAWVLGI